MLLAQSSGCEGIVVMALIFLVVRHLMKGSAPPQPPPQQPSALHETGRAMRDWALKQALNQLKRRM